MAIESASGGHSIWKSERRWRRSGSSECSKMIWVFPQIMVPPNHPILIGFSIINHPFWDTPIFGNTHIYNEFFKYHLIPMFIGLLSSLRHQAMQERNLLSHLHKIYSNLKFAKKIPHTFWPPPPKKKKCLTCVQMAATPLTPWLR